MCEVVRNSTRLLKNNPGSDGVKQHRGVTAMIETTIARRASVIDAVTAHVLKSAEAVEIMVGLVGVVFNAFYFSWSEARLMWPAYMFLFLFIGFVLTLFRDGLRRQLRDDDFDGDGAFSGNDVMLFLRMTALQSVANFFLMGVYGILIAALF
jgi:hypothetical protein